MFAPRFAKLEESMLEVLYESPILSFDIPLALRPVGDGSSLFDSKLPTGFFKHVISKLPSVVTCEQLRRSKQAD